MEPAHGETAVSRVTDPAPLSISLPLPPRVLHPNYRGHWQQVAREKRAYREVVWGIAYDAAPATPFTRCEVQLTFTYPNLRRRDPDNCLAWAKSALDSLVTAGVFSDDNADVVTYRPVRIEKGAPGLLIEVWDVSGAPGVARKEAT